MGVDFRIKQAEFAAYIRDPENQRLPVDVKPQRMVMYRELFFNNINSFLSSNFPVLRKILNDDEWQALAQDFFSRHRCQTPHFSEIAEEFLAYLQNEWVEMALSIAQVEPVYGDAMFAGDILEQSISLSPLAWPLVYQFPVERIGPDFLPQTAPEHASYLIVYRDRVYDVHFMKTTPLTYRLLQLIEQQDGSSGQDCLNVLAAELQQQIDPETLQEFGLQTLQELAGKDILIPAVAV
jgi:uncharacterized protein